MWTTPPPPVIHHTAPEANSDFGVDGECPTPTILIPPRTRSIDVLTHHHKQSVKSRSRLSLAPNCTLNSTHTDLASFHTPARILLRRQPRAVRVCPLLHSLALARAIVFAALILSQIILFALDVDNVDTNRAHDPTCTIRRCAPRGKQLDTIPSAARPKVVLYLRQNRHRRVRRIWL